MKTKLLAVVSTGALLLMSGPANAGGESTLVRGLARLGIWVERSVPKLRPWVTEFRPAASRWTRSSSMPRLKNDFDLPLIVRPDHAARDLLRDLRVSSLYDEATPQILDALKAPEALTQQQLESIINAAVKKAIEGAAKEKGSGITFEALTGKLKVDLSYTTPFANVTAGEVNVYKISAFLAAGVIACKDRPDFNECAKEALAKAGSAVAKEMVPESARIQEKTPTILDD